MMAHGIRKIAGIAFAGLTALSVNPMAFGVVDFSSADLSDLDLRTKSAVGTLMFNEESLCSGYVSDIDVITTSARCMFANIPVSDFMFKTIAGDERAVESVRDVNKESGVIRLNLKTDPELDEAFIATGEFDPTKPATMLSYSPDLLEFIVTHRWARRSEAGLILTEFDGVLNAPGAPLVQGGFVVGVHLGHTIERVTNVAVPLVNEGRWAFENTRSIGTDRNLPSSENTWDVFWQPGLTSFPENFAEANIWAPIADSCATAGGLR